MESATPSYFLLRELLERRPKGRHVKFVRVEIKRWLFHDIEQTQLRRCVDGVMAPKFDFHTGAP